MTPLLTVKDVAALFAVSAHTIRDRCAAGRMVPRPVLSRPYRFNAAQVYAVMDGSHTTERQQRKWKFVGKFRQSA